MTSQLRFALIEADSFDDIPAPAAPRTRCQTCDYWERLDGHRQAPDSGVGGAQSLKRSRLLAGSRLAGSYAMLAYDGGAPVGYAQFGPISAYPRAQAIRDRYPSLPDSPAPWVITCLQVGASVEQRMAAGEALLQAVCAELDRRGIVAVEAYPEAASDAWSPSAGPAAIYAAAGFELAAGDALYPAYRRELTGEGEGADWSDLLSHVPAADDDDDAWPLPLPPSRDDDLLRLPTRPKRPNPFGED